MTQRMLITGGAGFIGINAALFFARAGWEVAVLDNLSRRGALENLEWLRRRVNISFIRADVRDAKAVEKAFQEFAGLEAVLHLAAQVAVTTSVQDPRTDFEINVLGTLNVLEALRKHAPEAALIFASTNKVYGKMDELDVVLDGARYRFSEAGLAIDESRPLDFHSPYGCSKGAADQYVLDYARIYGLRTVSFRQSCIYGPYQFGIEDQGWVAWFAIAAFLGRSITIYGDGCQVRDVLYVGDLVEAFAAAIERADAIAGHAFNIGGGNENTLSLLELLDILEEELGRGIPRTFAGWRPGDQRVYISNIQKAKTLLEWAPAVDPKMGLRKLVAWVRKEQDLIGRLLS